MTAEASETVYPPVSRPGGVQAVRRWTFASLGIAFVVLGGIGVFLPGIPTVGPLLAASFFFTRSFPSLETRLMRIPLFRPYLQLIDGEVQMPWRTKLFSMLLMWVSIFFSCALICSRPVPHYWLSGMVVLLGLIGTWFIATFQRGQEFRKSTARGDVLVDSSAAREI